MPKAAEAQGKAEEEGPAGRGLVRGRAGSGLPESRQTGPGEQVKAFQEAWSQWGLGWAGNGLQPFLPLCEPETNSEARLYRREADGLGRSVTARSRSVTARSSQLWAPTLAELGPRGTVQTAQSTLTLTLKLSLKEAPLPHNPPPTHKSRPGNVARHSQPHHKTSQSSNVHP